MTIQVPASVTRPTTDFVRQALFSILADAIDGACVLDLFSGSGALGLEALSRGASSCIFVEQHRQAINTINKNLEKTRLSGGRVVTCSVDVFLKRDPTTYDIILADPPYWKHPGDIDEIGKLITADLIAPRLKSDGYFIAETSSTYRPQPSSTLRFIEHRAYGSSALLIYQKSPLTSQSSPASQA